MIDVNFWEFPLSLLLSAAFLIGIFLLRGNSTLGFGGKLNTRTFVVKAMIITSVFLIAEGTWGGEWFHHWLFVSVILLLMLSLGTVTIRDMKRKAFTAASFSHTGLFLVLFGGLFGAPDVSDSQMIVVPDKTEHISYALSQQVVPLPFEVQLKEFRTDYYENEISPKQYTSVIEVDGEQLETSVNHPCHYKGWSIYQSDFGNGYSVLKVVRDPWLWVVYAGMLLLTIGAVLGLKQAWKSWKVLPVLVLLTVAFTALSLARINLGTLMPALRSVWFVPHILIYMVAYSLLAIASAMGVWELWKKTETDIPWKLLQTSSSLLLIGMLCGAVWAKAAWGQYWTWDAKECWAAVTWMITLVGIHLPQRNRRMGIMLVVWISFLAMQITWYGVNYLPAAQNSMHTYN